MPYIATFTDWLLFFCDDALADPWTRFAMWPPSELKEMRARAKWQSYCARECK